MPAANEPRGQEKACSTGPAGLASERRLLQMAGEEMKGRCQVTERKAVLPLEGDDSRASRGQCDYKTAELRQSPSGLVSQSSRKDSQQAGSIKTSLDPTGLCPSSNSSSPQPSQPSVPNFPGTWKDMATMKRDIQAMTQELTAGGGN